MLVAGVAAAALALAVLGSRAKDPGTPRPDAPAELTSPLVLADGSRIDALSDARLFVRSARDVAIESGKARFSVVPQAAPFSVRTRRGTVLVLGTTFDVEVGEPDMNAKIPTAAAVVTITVVSGVILWKS